jgi:hypothetical protein
MLNSSIKFHRRDDTEIHQDIFLKEYDSIDANRRQSVV